MLSLQFSGRRRTQDVLASASSSFAKLQLSDTLRRALLLAGYRRPSPVQEAAIPLARLGSDLVVKAKSGTGKTLVFALASVDRVDASLPFPQALVLSPTREIAQQNASEIRKIANNLPFPCLSCGIFTGGVAVSEDRRQLRRPCQVVVGTPGRLNWLVQKNELNLDHIRLIVLDEADQLYASNSLKDTIQFLLRSVQTSPQILAFSATYPSEILSEIERGMECPQRVFVDECEKSLIGVKQCYKLVTDATDDSFAAKLEALFEIFSSVSFHQAVVFCNSRDKAETLAQRLNASGFPSAYTSGRKSQDHRSATMTAMRQFQLRVVISTDLIARGVDLERVNLVCNLDLPYDQQTYLHRIGRTGRFGTHGISVTLVTPIEKETLERYTATVEDANLIELPQSIPTAWYKDPLTTDSSQFQKRVESPVVPEILSHSNSSNTAANWSGTCSNTELLAWKERLERKQTFWHHWDPYSGIAMSRSSSREGLPRYATTSEMSCDTGSTSQRRLNCIRLPSRLSHTTSASSVVYSEEGDCEYVDFDDVPLCWSDEISDCPNDDEADHNAADVHDAEIQSLSVSSPLQPPDLPPSINSLADFQAARDQYEQWRKKYIKWREQYSMWYNSVQSSPHPPPQRI